MYNINLTSHFYSSLMQVQPGDLDVEVGEQLLALLK